MREWLEDGFEYDAWANRLWAAALQVPVSALEPVHGPGPWEEFPTGDQVVRLQSVFAHLLWSQRIWLERCGDRVSPAGADAETWIAALNAGWMAMIRLRDLDDIIVYRNSSGQQFERPFGHIPRHVITHGTYHRGQLREIFGAIKPEKVPSTDLIGFYPTLDLSGE